MNTDTQYSERKVSWYGWQLFLADCAALALLVTGYASEPLFFLGLGLFGLGAPSLHFHHGETKKAVVVGLLRILGPFAVLKFAYAIELFGASRSGSSETAWLGTFFFDLPVMAVTGFFVAITDWALAVRELEVSSIEGEGSEADRADA
ncbi:hypothetical protein FIV42_03500 [Persicimonas caeni]|uniref:Uncharacterized protein n=1 Tax=Persicimonas caeni TaxID=2292766 RepID=A0A4Y6PNE6_PERCE|nr:hypothetical protein [Persicimonas caeni]QDG49836.1 hypothetical protein FIV42_03500 [Persicimonas caeni]QED31057.1 hypothetical protein FRD00_03495 [Persicimonas caeni]